MLLANREMSSVSSSSLIDPDLSAAVQGTIMKIIISCNQPKFQILINYQYTFVLSALDIGDKLIEVVGLENCLHMGTVRTGLRSSGKRLAQCSSVIIKIKKKFPMQVDGEPVMMKPCRIEISLGNHSSAPSANMLVRNKNATCKNPHDAFDLFQEGEKLKNSGEHYSLAVLETHMAISFLQRSISIPLTIIIDIQLNSDVQN